MNNRSTRMRAMYDHFMRRAKTAADPEDARQAYIAACIAWEQAHLNERRDTPTNPA